MHESADIMPTLAMIRETDRIECEMESGSSYRDLRRTEIAIGAYAAAQALSGIYLTGFSAYFFERTFFKRTLS